MAETESRGISRIEGNLTGLAPAQIRSIEHLYRRKTHPDLLAGTELLRSLASITRDTGRQIGVLLDRRGRVRGVSVGTPHRITVPEFDRTRSSLSRLAGFRFIHSHPSGEGLDPDDLSDLALLRLDAIATLTVDQSGRPDRVEIGRLAPAAASSEEIASRVVRSGLIHTSDLPSDLTFQLRELENELARRAEALIPDEERLSSDRAMLLCIASGSRSEAEERLEELAALAGTAGVAIVGQDISRMRRIDPGTLIGRGRIERLSIDATHRGANLLIFDRPLTPVQVKNIGEATDLRVIDRTQLILDIFAKHAHTRDGKLQVELAQQRYRLPRLIGRNPALSRLAGGIGGQGPGESKLEIDRRRARERITRLEHELKRIENRRALERKARTSRNIPLVSLVGYTNAGKSTLFNQLTEASVIAQNQLFATLDPTTRRLYLGDGAQHFECAPESCLISDTVGFIRDLPDELLRAFHATLEELRDADLLLHVVDASRPNWREQEWAVNKTLEKLGLDGISTLVVFNKADALSEAALDQLSGGPLVSARTGEGLEQLRREVARALDGILRRRAEEAGRASA